uniref:Uncharacterized protein n=1 Tax=uncultured bacterium contig00060 TaxID=1181543 RepID=A0A806KET4_9BACT|nr:hypothetical protein [uncultured bacterium contig00060]
MSPIRLWYFWYKKEPYCAQTISIFKKSWHFLLFVYYTQSNEKFYIKNMA